MIRRHDVLFVGLPPPSGGLGHGQRGRHPVITLQDKLSILSIILVFPLTSRFSALRLPFTLRLEPSEVNGLSLPSVALLLQMQVIGKRRTCAKRAGCGWWAS